jgi:hypothetical protein
MSQKVRMRIYRLSGFQQNNPSTVKVLASAPIWRYLQNISVNDIQFYGTNTSKSPVSTDVSAVGTINLTVNNIPTGLPGTFPSTDFSKPYIVYDRYLLSTNEASFIAEGRYFVKINNRQFSILESQTNISNIQSIPPIFEFYVNPEHITPIYRKLNTEIRTRGGWEIQHYGAALTEVRVSGRTGGLQRDTSRTSKQGDLGQTLKPGESITLSTAWVRLNQLKLLYDLDHQIPNTPSLIKIGLNYYDKFYVGYFTDFQGPEADAQQPYIMNYTFAIKVEQEMSLQTFMNNNTAFAQNS